jgi:hypothetical protein
MRTGRLRTWAGLGVLALLTTGTLRAQELLPPLSSEPRPVVTAPPEARTSLPTTPVPVPMDVRTRFPAPADHGPPPPPPPPAAHPLFPDDPPPPFEAEEHGPAGLAFSADYLFLKARRNALDFAIASDHVDIPSGTLESLDWDSRSAFRFGAAYQLPADHWWIGATWTYFHSQDTRLLTSPPGGTLFATLTHAGGIDDVSTAFGASNIDYNVIDLDLSRKIEVANSLDLKLFGGGRFAWIDQKLDVTYNGGSLNAVNDHVSSPVFFRGAGLTVGGEGFWNVYRGAGLFAKVRGSLLSGQFRSLLTENNNNGLNTLVNVREKYYEIVPVTEIGLGIGYNGERLSLSVGYELSNWFNMVNSPDFPDGSGIGKLGRRSSDLTLEGLAVRLGLAF